MIYRKNPLTNNAIGTHPLNLITQNQNTIILERNYFTFQQKFSAFYPFIRSIVH